MNFVKKRIKSIEALRKNPDFFEVEDVDSKTKEKSETHYEGTFPRFWSQHPQLQKIQDFFSESQST